VTVGSSEHDEKEETQEQPNDERPFRVGTINKVLHDYGPYLTLGMQLAAAVLLFFFAGSWVDQHYDTEPTFTLIGIALGTAGGFVKFFRSVLDLQKKSESPQKDRQRDNNE
jgi:F0F1-type ATP synthase assembly protein I